MYSEHPHFRHPHASIVVVSYNTAAHIEECLQSLLDLDYPQVEIIVVDNASKDGSPDLIRSRFPSVELVEMPDNKGFAGAASVGLYMANGEILATVNPDVVLDRGWLYAVAETLDQYPDVGIVGSKIYYPGGKTLQHAGGVVHYPLATTDHLGRGEVDHGQHDQPKVVSFVTGAALAVRRDVGRRLRFFDEAYFPLYYEDVDLCWRADREGVRTVYQPKAVAYHKETVTVDRSSSLYYSYYHANRLRFVVKRYSPEQVMIDFLPAEAARVAGDMSVEDRTASLNLLDNRHTNGSSGGPKTIEQRLDTMQARIGEVMGGWQVYEKGARPRAARRRGVTGKLRNVLERLYIWPMMNKQIEYNASVARTLRELSWQLADLQARVSLQALLASGLVSRASSTSVEIATELDSLRSRVEELESEAGLVQQA